MKRFVYILVLFISIVNGCFAISRKEAIKKCVNYPNTKDGEVLNNKTLLYQTCMLVYTEIKADVLRGKFCDCFADRVPVLAFITFEETEGCPTIIDIFYKNQNGKRYPSTKQDYDQLKEIIFNQQAKYCADLYKL